MIPSITSNSQWLAFAQRLQALADTGLAYTEGEYDRERYEEIRAISLHMFALLSDAPVARIMALLPQEEGYVTPKVDVRAVVLRGKDELLMVQEKLDEDRWTLPGGWADVGYTPFEVAEKEAWEETGLQVQATRLLAVFDKKCHPHPPQPWYVYKFFVRCEVTGGELLASTHETSGAQWVQRDKLSALPLSEDRVTLSQLQTMLRFAQDGTLPTLCD